MIKCPKCGAENHDEANYCKSCAYYLHSVELLENLNLSTGGNKIEMCKEYSHTTRKSLKESKKIVDEYFNTKTQASDKNDNAVNADKKRSSLFGGLFKGKELDKLREEVKTLKQQNFELQKKLDDLGYDEFSQVKAEIEKQSVEIVENNEVLNNLRSEIALLSETREKEEKKLKTTANKLNKSRELYKSVEYSIENFVIGEPISRLTLEDTEDLDELAPSVILKLHYMDIKTLRKSFRENEKQIERLLSLYSARYTTKANQTIYQLMVIALRAELQNILYTLKYEKLDDAVEKVKEVSQKYLVIAGNGNQSIAATLTKFIGEIEYLFINAVKIEYNYYVKKEQARQEQLAIREQMRQEAEERRALEAEKKKVENEELKYNTEIERVKAQLEAASEEETKKLNARIIELQALLSDVAVKKENITNLQNGKAGNVYIISNLGSFGEGMFKIGMTRRLDPQERVDELGSASVPFKFDVHSFIFSEDAVALEKSLHEALADKRVNKVNLRKEFFYTNVDELEALVNSIDETAEFNKTMLAEEFRQSLSTDEVYSTNVSFDDEDE